MSSTLVSPSAVADSQRAMRAVLAPRSIALIGASDSPGRPTARPLAYLDAAGYSGAVYVVNPRRETVGGHHSYASVTDLPEAPEHALIMTPARTVPEIVEDCVRLGVKAISILSDGFAEAGAEGAALQERIVEIVRTSEVRILGPNSIGLVNLVKGIPMTGNAVFGNIKPTPGTSFLVSQSGSMIGSLVTRGVDTGTNFSTVVSSGGELDITAPELAMAALDDPETSEILLFLEHVNDPIAVADLGRRASKQGIPVVAFSLGRSTEASALSVSHTGALAGEDELTQRLLLENGIARVTTLSGLLTAGKLLKDMPLRNAGDSAPRIGILTTTGGAAATIVDELATRGCTLGRASTATLERLSEFGVGTPGLSIIDLTLAGANPETMSGALEVLGNSEEFDALIMVIGSSARLTPETTIGSVIEAARNVRVPVSVFLVPEAPAARSLLHEAGIPVFTQPETIGDVFAAATTRQRPRQQSSTYPPRVQSQRPRTLDEVESYEHLSAVGIAPASYAVLATDVNGEIAGELPKVPFPNVVKILDSRIAHKSDMGGIVLGVESEAQLRNGAHTVVARAQAHLKSREPHRVLVQEMAQDGLGEFLVGYRNDPHVGPVIMVAGGGVRAELYDDKAVRLAPVTEPEARRMLTEVKAARIIDGYRGLPAGDIDGLASLIVSMSRLAEDPSVAEAEINPVLVMSSGIVPVDCLVTLIQEKS